jgi:hypothetical protein
MYRAYTGLGGGADRPFVGNAAQAWIAGQQQDRPDCGREFLVSHRLAFSSGAELAQPRKFPMPDEERTKIAKTQRAQWKKQVRLS